MCPVINIPFLRDLSQDERPLYIFRVELVRYFDQPDSKLSNFVWIQLDHLFSEVLDQSD